jgi:hypothetical protein
MAKTKEEQDQRVFTCGECGEEFENRSDLRQHVYDEHVDPDRDENTVKLNREHLGAGKKESEEPKRIVVVWQNLTGGPSGNRTAWRPDQFLAAMRSHTHAYDGGVYPCYPQRWQIVWYNPNDVSDWNYGKGELHEIDI